VLTLNLFVEEPNNDEGLPTIVEHCWSMFPVGEFAIRCGVVPGLIDADDSSGERRSLDCDKIFEYRGMFDRCQVFGNEGRVRRS
jgi:hypothetical protein